MTNPLDSGQALLRQALAAHNMKRNLVTMARDVGVPSPALEAFAYGSASLSPDVLKALALRILDAVYDPLTDKLSNGASQEPRLMGNRPLR